MKSKVIWVGLNILLVIIHYKEAEIQGNTKKL